jgi:hypothetical protein
MDKATARDGGRLCYEKRFYVHHCISKAVQAQGKHNSIAPLCV